MEPRRAQRGKAATSLRGRLGEVNLASHRTTEGHRGTDCQSVLQPHPQPFSRRADVRALLQWFDHEVLSALVGLREVYQGEPGSSVQRDGSGVVPSHVASHVKAIEILGLQ